MALHAISRLSLTLAAIALSGVGATYAVSSWEMFSPGALHAGDSTRVALGGVESHAQLVHQCGACHANIGSTRPMATRCLECHADIRDQLTDSSSLHGSLPNIRKCMSCHTEHLGATASLTRVDGSPSMHAALGFPLDGAHRNTTCAKCHASSDVPGRFGKAPKTCVGCHQRDDTHNGELGGDCASCHSTNSWKGARFDHEVFPLDHGGEGRIACKTCHEDPKNYKSYTCMGCHEHSPARVAAEHHGEVDTSELRDCLRCHAGGREHGERSERRGRERWRR